MEEFISYDDIFKEIEQFKNEYPKEKLLKFIRELSINWSTQRDISEKQYKILKESLDNVFENDRERQLLENSIIRMCPKYVLTNFNQDQFTSLYLNFIKDYFTCKDQCKFSNILILLKNNLNNFNIELSNKIIKLLFEIYKENLEKEKQKEQLLLDQNEENQIIFENDIGNSKLLDEISLLNCILLFKDKIGIQGFNSNNGEFKELILELINSFYEFIIPTDDEAERFEISISFENLIFLIQLFENYKNRESYLNLLLKFVYFFECIQTSKYYQIKYHDQLLEAIESEKVLFGNKESFTLIERLIKTLLKNGRFDVFKLQGLLMSINRGSYNEYFKYIFSIVEFDILIPIVQSSFPNINPKNIIKEILEIKRMEKEFNNNQDNNQLVDIPTNEIKETDRFYKSLESFFKIENYFQGENSKVEKKYLKKTYLEIFKELNQSRLLEASLDSLFYKLDEFPIKLKFIKKQLNFILSQLDLYSIKRVISKCNCLKKELEENSIYKRKLLLLESSENEIESLEFMPFEIIENIIYFLINSKSTTQFRKLEISLVSRDFFKMVQSIMNRSIEIPIELNSNHFFHHGTGGQFSLFQQKQVSYIKYWATPIYSEPDDIESFLYRLNVVDSFKEWGHIISYTNENKLKALDFRGDLDNYHLDYLKSNKVLQKLIIRTTSTNANQLHEPIKQMIQEKQSVKIHLDLDVKEEEPNINYRINFDLIQGCTISIGQFFDKDFHDHCIQKVKSLTIIVEPWDISSTSNFETIPIINQYITSTFSTTTTYSNLKHLLFNFKTFDTDFEYFDKLIKLFKGGNSVKSITFKNPGGGDKCTKPKKVILNILKSIDSSNLFPSLQYIKILNSFNLTMFENINDEKDWFNIFSKTNSNFKPESNFIKFNFIKNNNNINKNKRKFEQV